MAEAKRLIDANKARVVAQRIYSDPVLVHVILNTLDETPSVDAVEVVHGHWISKGYKIECSACGHRAFLGTHDPVIHTEEKNICKYCPNCGAKMDGGNEDV